MNLLRLALDDVVVLWTLGTGAAIDGSPSPEAVQDVRMRGTVPNVRIPIDFSVQLGS